jgi:hypothetical protein
LNRNFYFDIDPSYYKHAITRLTPESLLDVFDVFIPNTLMEQVLLDIPAENMMTGSLTNKRVTKSLSTAYKVLASYIYITGQQFHYPEGSGQTSPIRESFQAASNYFATNIADRDINFPCERSWKTYMSEFLFTNHYFPQISENFQAPLDHIGQYAAGDEKLLHFTGDSVNIRLVPSKPDRIGFWFFELVVKLSNGTPYLIYMRLNDASAVDGVFISTEDVVRDWCDIVKGDDDPRVILCFDSYYLSHGSHDVLTNTSTIYVAACKENVFRELTNYMRPYANTINVWHGIYKESTGELFIKMFDSNENIGMKYCMSSAYTKFEGRAPRLYGDIVPAYDLYKLCFNLCDKFNRNLCDRVFPHRTGGRGHSGNRGHQHKFAMAVILENIFSLFNAIHQVGRDDWTFSDYCSQLALAIYKRVC